DDRLDHLLSKGGVGTVIDGGAGTDIVSFDRSASTQDLTFDLTQASTSTGVTMADGTTIKNVEQVGTLYFGSGDDYVSTDGRGAETLYGGDYSVSNRLAVDASWATANIDAEGPDYYDWTYVTIGTVTTVSARSYQAFSFTGGSGDDVLNPVSSYDR